MQRSEAGKLVAVILAANPNHRVTAERVPAMVDAYADLLADLEYQLANAALRALLQTSAWMPTPADIRKAALELGRGPTRTGLEAWGSVLAAMQGQGAYRTPGVDFVFYDPVTARCVDVMGWQELCLSENTVADRARFIEAYEVMAQRDFREAQSPVLTAARERRAISVAAAVAKVLDIGQGKPDE